MQLKAFLNLASSFMLLPLYTTPSVLRGPKVAMGAAMKRKCLSVMGIKPPVCQLHAVLRVSHSRPAPGIKLWLSVRRLLHYFSTLYAAIGLRTVRHVSLLQGALGPVTPSAVLS
jgi:hypothetical protein